MVIGKSLLGTGARIPCIRTRLQVTDLGLSQFQHNGCAEASKALFTQGAGGERLSLLYSFTFLPCQRAALVPECTPAQSYPAPSAGCLACL